MPAIEIRPAVSTDIPDLLTMDHSVETTHTWQMDRSFERGGVTIAFRETRLPRTVRLPYPRRVAELRDEWNKRAIVLVAALRLEVVGYASLKIQQATSIAWLVDLARRWLSLLRIGRCNSDCVGWSWKCSFGTIPQSAWRRRWGSNSAGITIITTPIRILPCFLDKV
jgi:hypothetical protein